MHHELKLKFFCRESVQGEIVLCLSRAIVFTYLVNNVWLLSVKVWISSQRGLGQLLPHIADKPFNRRACRCRPDFTNHNAMWLHSKLQYHLKRALHEMLRFVEAKDASMQSADVSPLG